MEKYENQVINGVPNRDQFTKIPESKAVVIPQSPQMSNWNVDIGNCQDTALVIWPIG